MPIDPPEMPPVPGNHAPGGSGRTPSAWPFVAAGALLLGLGCVANEWVLGAWLTSAGRVTNPASRLLLLGFDVVVLMAGGLLLIRRRQAPWREMLLSVAAMLLSLGLAEGGLRLWFEVRGRFVPQERELAAGIGWRPVANASIDSQFPGFGSVRYTTVRDGFRVFGDVHSAKPKVLVLGDSFTEAATVSDGEAYYQWLAAARPDLEFFAIGGGGYGTLQEYMLLDEYADAIKPDLVLLQLHPNDLINNSHALESRSTSNNNQMTRPYWEDGRVVQRFPENPAWGPLYNLVRHSYLMRLLNVNLRFLRSQASSTIEQSLTPDDPAVRQATETTVQLLVMMRERAKVPVVAFSAMPEHVYPFWSRSETCRRAGVPFIPGVGEAVDAAAAAGEIVTGLPVDAHWNGRGHAIAAQVIGDWLQRQGLPAKR